MRIPRREGKQGVPMQPGPVGIAVKAEQDRRRGLLDKAVSTLKPLVDFLEARKLEGGKVSLSLEAPSEPNLTDVTGRLCCAPLHPIPEQGRSRPVQRDGYEYFLTVFQDGRVRLQYPDPDTLNADEDEDLLWNSTFDGGALARAVEEAEVGLELKRTPSPTPFKI